MSNPFVPANYAPSQLGLRQRHPPSSSNDAVGGVKIGGGNDENADPNSSRRDSWMGKVPAPPPRARLAAFGSGAAAQRRRERSPQRRQPTGGRGPDADPNQCALVRTTNETNEREEGGEDLSLWAVGYGYRDEPQFRALYRRLENCGTIVARRGGLACFGETPVETAGAGRSDVGGNWVAVKYESALRAQKALGQHNAFLYVGGSTMVMGVMGLNERDAAARLGISVKGQSREVVNLSGHDGRKKFGTRKGEDLMLLEGSEGRLEDGEARSSADSLCGRVLAWFFMWDDARP